MITMFETAICFELVMIKLVVADAHLPSIPSCAGQSPVGESFLLGKGPAGAPPSKFCEWLPICKLMAAPLPGKSKHQH